MIESKYLKKTSRKLKIICRTILGEPKEVDLTSDIAAALASGPLLAPSLIVVG